MSPALHAPAGYTVCPGQRTAISGKRQYNHSPPKMNCRERVEKTRETTLLLLSDI
jgi:hypothetical protein